MDAFKLAFETLIIGLLALPWLWVMIDLANPDLFKSSPKRTIARLMALVPHDLRTSAISLAGFAVAYLLGLVIAPIATEFLNDRELIGRVLYTAERIQVKEYEYMEKQTDLPAVAAMAHSNPVQNQSVKASQIKNPNFASFRTEDKWQQAKFQYQESVLLRQGANLNDRLNRLHERLTVLGGATFSAFVLLLLFLFAACAKYRAGHLSMAAPISWKTRACVWGAWLPSVSVTALALTLGAIDIKNGDIGDMPIMEALLFFLGALGCHLMWRGTQSRLPVRAWACLCTLFFFSLCYGGYACTQVSYDQEVFNSYLALSPENGGNSAHPAALTTMAGSVNE